MRYKKNIITILLSLFVLLIPVFVFADNTSNDSGNNTGKTTKLQNPLQYDSVPGIIGGIVKTALGIIGSLALLAFVVGAGRWLISAGKSDQVKKGAQTMLYAVIGVFVVLASYGILNLVLETFVN